VLDGQLKGVMAGYGADFILSLNFYEIASHYYPLYLTPYLKAEHRIDYEIMDANLGVVSAGRLYLTSRDIRATAMRPQYAKFAREVADRLEIALTSPDLASARRGLQALRERTERVEVQTREAERQRIAREMHDVLAHRLSLLSVHAGALEFRPDAPAAEVGEAAGVIRRSAHAALEELREVIGVLRHEGGDGSLEPPQPTLADIPGLVEESRTAGMSVELELAVTGEPFPAALGRTAYRIVQEGLTNARKHAPGAAVGVSLAGTGESLTVEVRSHPPVGVTAAVVPGGGAGLVGLAERVTLAGGALEHGVGAAGAFVLRARLPR